MYQSIVTIFFLFISLYTSHSIVDSLLCTIEDLQQLLLYMILQIRLVVSCVYHVCIMCVSCASCVCVCVCVYMCVCVCLLHHYKVAQSIIAKAKEPFKTKKRRNANRLLSLSQQWFTDDTKTHIHDTYTICTHIYTEAHIPHTLLTQTITYTHTLHTDTPWHRHTDG